jgi:hypothetical protein
VTATTAPAASGGTSTGRKVAAWILGVAGVGMVAVGGALTLKAQQDFDAVKTKYNPATEKQGKDYMKASYLCYGAGGVAVIVALITGFSGSSSAPAVALAPAVGPAGAGAVLSGRF